ncbi:MAG: RraA family protein [Pelagibacterales bacterium]|jgi:regulator of RNase E activity RraA|nr:RraA family protein [Pelagibacterales bacterium]|tara:strand:- start:784 stop:1473 length:690 start_codon:yes stop_codon:yes gene_type:complete
MIELQVSDLVKLQTWDTPTICNALDVAAPNRRAIGFTTRPLVPVGIHGSVCGYVKTAKISGKNKPLDNATEIRTSYYKYIAEKPKPSIVLIEDIDNPEGFGAFWGEVNSAIHLGLGVKGLITNGVVRDLDQWANGFAALAGSIGPSHAYTQVIEYSTEINIYGMQANDSDIIHFDKHGAVIIPKEVVKLLPGIIEKQMNKEAVILEAARSPDFNINKLLAAMKNAAEIH